MFGILIMIVAAIGLANAISNENVFAWLRYMLENTKASSFASCVVCVAFWTGLIMSFSIPSLSSSLDCARPFRAILIGLCSSILAKIISVRYFTF